jgi:hypothetical protein
MTSSDGINWTNSTNIFGTGSLGNAIATNGNIWVAVGGSGTLTNSIAYSYDGITWVGLGVSIFSTAGFGVCWNGRRFVAVGQGTNTIAYSDDGISWTGAGATILTTKGDSITWNGTRFIAGGSGTNWIAYSSNGINWTGVNPSDLFANGVYGIYSNQPIPRINIANPIIIFGADNVSQTNGANSMSYSFDGRVWRKLGNTMFSNYGNKACWNGKLWVAVGNGSANTIAYSYDGFNWTGLGTTIFSTCGWGITWNGTMFVAVGQGTNSIAYSYDGINWTGLGTTIFTIGYDIAWSRSRNIWVAAGEGGNVLAYSTNGINWTAVSDSPITLKVFCVAWGGDKFVAGGSGSKTTAYSFDGINWTSAGLLFTNSALGVAYNGKRWVMGGDNGASVGLRYSDTGILWTSTTAPTVKVNSVCWNGRIWVIGGTGDTSSYSYDGVNWYSGANPLGFQANGFGTINDLDPSLFNSQLWLVNSVNSNKLDIVSEGYYNSGFNNVSISFKAQELQ